MATAQLQELSQDDVDWRARSRSQSGEISKKVFLITGPQTVGQRYFDKYYVPLIEDALTKYPGCRFVLGDADGVDRLAQKYLAGRVSSDRVTVYIKAGKTAKLADQQWTVNNSAVDYPSRDLLMAREATRMITVLPQYGGGTGGSLLPIMTHPLRFFIQDDATRASAASDVCGYIRTCSEPYDADVQKLMGLFAELLCTPVAERDPAKLHALIDERLRKE